jgi:peroxin-19
MAQPPPPKDADSDPDFDDLDDVLDQFNTNAPHPPSQAQSHATANDPTKPTTTDPASGPGRPSVPIPEGPKPEESEDEFIKRLTAEMSNVMGQMSNTSNLDSKATPEDLEKMGRELEEFTHKMEAEGIKPEDLLKAILGEDTGAKIGEAAHEERERRESEAKSPFPSASKATSPPASSTKKTTDSKKPPPASFEDTIRSTINRLESSSAAATSASQTQSEEDMLADLLKSLGNETGEGEGDLSKMFLGMMEQLTNKDMLYEPMKELDEKFPKYLSDNKDKLKAEDAARYNKQKEIVKNIVSKFEEKNYSDEDPKCREFIWEKMQLMQEQGAPPEELVQGPGGLPGLGGGMPGMGDEGCPTQ